MSKPTIISSTDLRQQLEDEFPAPLVDVRPAEDFAAEHLPGAVNHCVFDRGFVVALSLDLPFKTEPICVYGRDGASYEARMAAQKLLRAGYTEVLELREGIAGWKLAGFETEAGEGAGWDTASQPGASPPPAAGHGASIGRAAGSSDGVGVSQLSAAIR